MKTRLLPLLTFAAFALLPALALAQGAQRSGPHDAFYALAMGLGMGFSVLGAGMGQGRAASAALEGICRNPNSVDKVFTPMLLALAFPESLVIFTFVTGFLIYTKFGF